MDVASFTDFQYGNNLQECLDDVAFVTGTMCDPNEPQTFQQAWHCQIKMQEKNGVKQSD